MRLGVTFLNHDAAAFKAYWGFSSNSLGHITDKDAVYCLYMC